MRADASALKEIAVKALLYSIWLWVISDPERFALAALALAVGTWKALPLALRVSLEKRFPRVVGGLRVIVKLAPDVIGALRVGWHQALKARPRATIEARPQEPASPSSSEPGFAERSVLHVIAGVCALALGIALLTGCPMPAPDGCTPFATRCSPSGIPETCSQSGRWSYAPPAVPCAQRGPVVCCNTRSPWGRELHACTPQSECLPERASDAGAEVSDGE